MLRRGLSIFLTLLIVLSIGAVPIASASEDYSDYVAGNKNPNLVTGSNASLLSGTKNASVTYDGSSVSGAVAMSVDAGKSANFTKNVNGFYRVNTHSSFNSSVIKADTNYVVEMQLRNVGTTEAPMFGVMFGADSGSFKTVPIIESSADAWQDFKYTVGNLEQPTFTWKALNADRTAVENGITITPGENGTATVSVDSNVAAGDYVIFTNSGKRDATTNAKIQKGITITVVEYAEKSYGYDNLNNDTGELTIGFIGGSITIGANETDRYATHVTNWFAEQYPNKNVKQVNAGISGTPSVFGMYRVNSDIGAYAPDVVFVEFAVNDIDNGKLATSDVELYMETIVRNLLALPKEPVIIFLYSANDDSSGSPATHTIPYHDAVAEYYNISSINFYEYMKDAVAEGKYVWEAGAEETLSDDGTHPNAEGHKIYADYIIDKLESENILHKSNNVNAPLANTAVTGARDISMADSGVVKTGEWTNLSPDTYHEIYNDVYEAQGIDSSVTLSFKGSTIGISYVRGNGTYSIDGGEEVSFSDAGVYIKYKILATDLGEGEHSITIKNTGTTAEASAGTASTNLQLARFLVSDGDNIVAATIDENGDYVPGSKPANILSHPYSGYTSVNSSNVSVAEADGVVTWEVKTAYEDNYYEVAPSLLTVDGKRISKSLEAGKNYVVYANVKNGVAGMTPTFAIMLEPYRTLPYESMKVTDTEKWTEFKKVLTQTRNSSSISMGFNMRNITNTVGEVIKMNIANGRFMPYIAEEIAYDITNTVTSASSTVPQGSSITVEAKVVNQIGITGKLNQNFRWMALNADRTAFTEGITVTPQSSSVATVSVSENVPSGKYVIVAVSDDYEGFRKGVTITVEGNEPEAKVTALELTEENGVASLSASVENAVDKDILFVIASYTTGDVQKLSDIVIRDAEPVSGVASISDLTLSVNAGEKVQAFVWDESFNVIKHVEEFTASITAQGTAD